MNSNVAAAPVRLAVFDYDGTIIDGQSGSLFSRYLLMRGLISAKTAAGLAWWGTRYKLHLPYRQDESRELIFGDLCKLGREETLRILHDFHDTVLAPRYRVDAICEVMRRQEEGCATLLVSATFYEIARVAAEALGMTAPVATRMRLDAQGNYTSDVEGEVVAGEGKVRAVSSWADANIGAASWDIAYAYGDHFTDASLLECAEHPFAVCPGPSLKHLARGKGWPVLEWE